MENEAARDEYRETLNSLDASPCFLSFVGSIRCVLSLEVA